MKPSTAFETTPDDVLSVMAVAGRPLTFAQAETLFGQHVAEQAGAGGRIERAALHGDDLEDQTEYAHQEIGALLQECGVLPAPR